MVRARKKECACDPTISAFEWCFQPNKDLHYQQSRCINLRFGEEPGFGQQHLNIKMYQYESRFETSMKVQDNQEANTIRRSFPHMTKEICIKQNLFQAPGLRSFLLNDAPAKQSQAVQQFQHTTLQREITAASL